MARNEAYELLRLIRRYTLSGDLPRSQVSWCSSRPVPAYVRVGEENGQQLYLPTKMSGTVQVAQIEPGLHGYRGLQRCANPMVCPVCSRKISVIRAEEVARVVAVMISLGYKIAMMTLTAAHTVDMEFGDIYKGWTLAEGRMKRLKGWKHMNLAYFIRAIEVTDDAPHVVYKSRTGWHVHAHYILFFEPDTSIEEIELYESEIEKMWISSLKKEKLSAKSGVACKFNIPRQNGDIKKIVGYVTKGAAYEITGSRWKTGRGNSGKPEKESRRISIWELQRIALHTGNKKLLGRYAEYMKGCKKKKFFTWSDGLRELVGQPIKTDEDIMNEKSGNGNVIYEFTRKEWALVVKHGAQGRIIDAADEGGVDAIIVLLEQLAKSMRFNGDDIACGNVLLRSPP